MRISVFLLLIMVSFGCVEPISGPRNKPDGKTSSSISDMAYEACQKRDMEAGKRLKALGEEIKSGRRKYDSQVLDEIKKINTETAVDAFSAVERRLVDSFDPSKEKLNPEKVGNAVIQYGIGREKAGM